MERLTDVGYIPERVVANMTMEQLAGIYRKLSEYENTELEPQDMPDALEMCKIKMAIDNLAEYQNTNLTPDQIRELDRLYLEKCEEANRLKAELEEERQKRRWIPVEERLPKESGVYIVSTKENDLEHVTFCKWQTRYKRWDLTGSRAYWKVIAWQPLPEPYQPEKGGAE